MWGGRLEGKPICLHKEERRHSKMLRKSLTLSRTDCAMASLVHAPLVSSPLFATKLCAGGRKFRPIWCTVRPGGPLLRLAAQRRPLLSRLVAEDAKIARSANTLACARATVKMQQGMAENVATGTSSERPRLMVVSDLDCTMVDHTDQSHAALLRFNNLWASEYAHNSTLVFSTGRSVAKYKELRSQAPLLTPNIGIFSVGTEIRYGESMVPDQDWESFLDDGWNQAVVLEEVNRLNLRLQDESEIRPHKVSCQIDKMDAPRIIDTLSSRLKDHGLKAKIIFSHGLDLDVLPQGAGKGEALAFLLRKLKSRGGAPQNTLVCGDSGNDIELFEVEDVNGVIVGGAMEELVHWYEKNGISNGSLLRATERCAGGIVEAIQKFSLGPHLSPGDRIGPDGILPSVTAVENGQASASGSAQREVVEFNTLFEKWMNGEVPNNDEVFQRLTSVLAPGATMVYPWGVEQNLFDHVSSARSKHGLTKDNKFRAWIDCIKEQKLGDGFFMVTWHSWQISKGVERKGYFATAIFQEKRGTPNGVEWIRAHETSRKL